MCSHREGSNRQASECHMHCSLSCESISPTHGHIELAYCTCTASELTTSELTTTRTFTVVLKLLQQLLVCLVLFLLLECLEQALVSIPATSA